MLAATLLACVYSAAAAAGALAGSPTPAAENEIPAPDAVGTGQEAVTDQAAAATSSAVQQQPTNLVVTVRIDSPGNDGPISQTNVVVGIADASNSASQTQTAEPGESGAGASDQAAETGQAAGATATATQNGAQNIVVIVRINSPGDSGPISQTNTTVAISDATNDSATTQRAGSGPDGAAPPAAQPEGAPAPGPAAAAPAPRRRAPASATRSSEPNPAAAVRSSAPVAPAAHVSGGTRVSSAAGRAGAHRSASHARPAGNRRAATVGRALQPGAIAARTADFLGSLTPPRSTAAPDSAADISGSVLYSLLAALAAAAGFLFWPLLAGRLRLAGPRNRLRG